MRTDVTTALSTDRQGWGSKRSLWEQTDVLHCRRHAPLHTRCVSCDHCIPCIQAVINCLTCILFVDSLMDLRTRITAFATPQSPRRSPPNGRARCAPQSSRGWRSDRPNDGQRSRPAPELPDSNRLPDIRSAPRDLRRGTEIKNTCPGDLRRGTEIKNTCRGDLRRGTEIKNTCRGDLRRGTEIKSSCT